MFDMNGNVATRLVSKCTSYFYPSQTKILEWWTKDEIRMFEALFKGASTRFGQLTIEKSVEHPDFIICSPGARPSPSDSDSEAMYRKKNGAISSSRLYEWTCIREYSIRPFDTLLPSYFIFYCILARLLSTHVCKFIRTVVGTKLRHFFFAIPAHVGDANGARRSRFPSKMLYGYSDFVVFLKIVF